MIIYFKILLLFFVWCAVFLFGVSGAGGIICQMTDIPLLQIYSFMTLMCCGMAGNVISAITVETFPTSSR